MNCKCLTPLSWHHNAKPWCHHIRNITNSWSLEVVKSSDVNTTGKYLFNFGTLTSRDKNKAVVLRLTPLGKSDGPYHVTSQSYYKRSADGCALLWTVSMKKLYVCWGTNYHGNIKFWGTPDKIYLFGAVLYANWLYWTALNRVVITTRIWLRNTLQCLSSRGKGQ